ncbi:MAG TPA: metalloregulator ArsR/SmtB family transcription factor [Aliidongia sp.]|nr:metalloregulator ArsR/SmtB family transcription factor [Aliidongia sp.]
MTATGAELDHILAALADPTRRQMIDLLRARPYRAGELAAAFDMGAPLMSKHLRVLRTSRLIEEARLDEDARVRLYQLRPQPFEQLQAWLETVQALWSDQLDSFKRYAEAAERGQG